ncbi:hypothetical protein, partial [Providencia rettgeri]|uniref:hypothetical protein n=1 Tax=Providencia rettgeri TaxID=587 RepID=UPI0029DC51C9
GTLPGSQMHGGNCARIGQFCTSDLSHMGVHDFLTIDPGTGTSQLAFKTIFRVVHQKEKAAKIAAFSNC